MSKSKASGQKTVNGSRPKKLTTVQRARLCVFENETGVVVVSAAERATIIARMESEAPITLAPGIPAFWIAERELAGVLGEASWDALIRRVEYCLLSITFAEWSEERLLVALRRVFPAIELQTVDDGE